MVSHYKGARACKAIGRPGIRKGTQQGKLIVCECVIADFLIGAHALVHADRLFARDPGHFRDYFKALSILDPSR
jgi:predicted nucleic acid-binding protein